MSRYKSQSETGVLRIPRSAAWLRVMMQMRRRLIRSYLQTPVFVVKPKLHSVISEAVSGRCLPLFLRDHPFFLNPSGGISAGERACLQQRITQFTSRKHMRYRCFLCLQHIARKIHDHDPSYSFSESVGRTRAKANSRIHH